MTNFGSGVRVLFALALPRVAVQRLFGVVLWDRCREYIHVEPAPPRARLSHLQRGVAVLIDRLDSNQGVGICY
jgi:hypothetical protein